MRATATYAPGTDDKLRHGRQNRFRTHLERAFPCSWKAYNISLISPLIEDVLSWHAIPLEGAIE